MASHALDTLAVTVRKAARALGRSGLVHAYGHCSARIDAGTFLVAPSRPLGHVGVGEECTIVPVEGDLPDGVLGEVRLHQQIYRARPEIGGVVRIMGPKIMALAALGRSPQPRHGFGTYFSPHPPIWRDPQLIRDDERAEEAIAVMGTNSALLMQGNGAVVADERLEGAVVLSWYLEDACRVELDALMAGLVDTAPIIPPEAAAQRATRTGFLFERMWNYLTESDPE